MSSNAHRFEGRISSASSWCWKYSTSRHEMAPTHGSSGTRSLTGAELWRPCDLNRILRTNGEVKQNKCRYHSYWALGPKAQETWYELMWLAKRRLISFRAGETEKNFLTKSALWGPESYPHEYTDGTTPRGIIASRVGSR
jgi:hypothetical protein